MSAPQALLRSDWNASLYDRRYAFVFEYGKDLFSLLAPQPGEIILDLGCGTGHLTKAIADAGAGVIGLDSSSAMIERAHALYPDVRFVQADARDFEFAQPFDAVFSNATLHWIPEAGRVAVCVARALKRGGRFVAELGGRGNVAAIIEAVRQAMRELVHVEVHHGWYFPSLGEYAVVLETHGLSVNSAVLFDRPTRLEDGEQGLVNWITMFGQQLLCDVPVDMKHRVLERVEDILRPVLFKEGHWYADYRRLRVVAVKE